VTLTTSAQGTVRVAGKGLKTTSKNLTAGTHQIRVALTKAGRSMRAHHKKITVSASLTVAGRTAAKTARSVRL
jgi:primosomal replication protein N